MRLCGSGNRSGSWIERAGHRYRQVWCRHDQAAREICRRALEDDTPIEAYAEQLRDLFDEELRIVVYRVLFGLAAADGGIHEAEREMLKRLPQHLGIKEQLFDALWEEVLGIPANLEEHYQVLGLSPQASIEEVRKAYRRLSKEYHPDSIASMGLPEGFQKFATEQMQRINAAYDAIMRAHGASR